MDHRSLPTHYAVAIAISSASHPSKILTVKRPYGLHEELPGLWGLPATSLNSDETYQQAASRVANEKLGGGVILGKILGESKQIRNLYVLVMRLYEGTLSGNEPRLPYPPPNPDITYYTTFQWGPPTLLQEGAELGSLCSQILLSTLNP